MDSRPALRYTQGMNAQDFKTIHRIADIESHRAHHRLSWLSVQDLYQEAWLHLLESWDTYDPERGALSTWAVRRVRGHLYDCTITQRRWGVVAHGAARQAVRYSRDGDTGPFRRETLDSARVGVNMTVPLSVEFHCVYEANMGAVDVPRMMNAIGRIRSKPRREVMEAISQGFTPTQIAKARGITPEGVQQHRRRGLKHLNAWATRTG